MVRSTHDLEDTLPYLLRVLERTSPTTTESSLALDAQNDRLTFISRWQFP